MNDKSDLEFLNLVRALPIFPLNAPREEWKSLDPLHQGVEGKKHWKAKAKLESIEADESSLKEEEEAEIKELLGDFK